MHLMIATAGGRMADEFHQAATRLLGVMEAHREEVGAEWALWPS